jgi:hypothetical protein
MSDLFSKIIKENGEESVDLCSLVFISWSENENKKYGK